MKLKRIVRSLVREVSFLVLRKTLRVSKQIIKKKIKEYYNNNQAILKGILI